MDQPEPSESASRTAWGLNRETVHDDGRVDNAVINRTKALRSLGRFDTAVDVMNRRFRTHAKPFLQGVGSMSYAVRPQAGRQGRS